MINEAKEFYEETKKFIEGTTKYFDEYFLPYLCVLFAFGVILIFALGFLALIIDCIKHFI